jgi:hypothetical protein
MMKPREMEVAGHITQMGEKRNAYRIFVGKPEEKRPLERPRYRWVDSVEMGLRLIWINLVRICTTGRPL